MKSWQQACGEALSGISHLKASVLTNVDFPTEVRRLQDLLPLYVRDQYAPSPAYFQRLGSVAWVWGQQRSGSDLTFEHVAKTLVAKQRDYGHRNIADFGLLGIFVRLNDKIARLANLLGASASPANESLADTFLDIVGYCAIALMLQADTFHLELANDEAPPRSSVATSQGELVGYTVVERPWTDSRGLILGYEQALPLPLPSPDGIIRD